MGYLKIKHYKATKRILKALRFANERIFEMQEAIAALTEKVVEIETVVPQVVAQLQDLKVQILALQADPVAVQALAERIDDMGDALTVAVGGTPSPG